MMMMDPFKRCAQCKKWIWLRRDWYVVNGRDAPNRDTLFCSLVCIEKYLASRKKLRGWVVMSEEYVHTHKRKPTIHRVTIELKDSAGLYSDRAT
jgi:hypothetical protein